MNEVIKVRDSKNYKVLKDIDEKGWKEGDIVKIHGEVSEGTIERGYLEEVDNDLEHKHTLVVVDTIKLNLTQ